MSPRSGPGSGQRLTDPARLAWLRLIRSENVGPRTFRLLINRYGGAEAALDALPGLASKGGRRIKVVSKDSAEAELARAATLGARFVALGEADYPALLRHADLAPPLVAVMGDAAVSVRPALAMVGARNASASGRKLARQFAAELSAAGFVVVSGLARGIDAAAHEGALEGGTIGVFAGGLDRPYPPENKPLMRKIVDSGGLLVSEMPFGWEPRARDFPRRNRIVAGLGLGCLVVEAALRSGSLISARFAGELGRLVLAVPGSPLDPRAGGTNRLLKDGATLVTETSDIVEALRPLDGRTEPHRPLLEPDALFDETPGAGAEEPSDADRDRVLQALNPVPMGIDDLILAADATPGVVQLVLLELDLAGRLERHPGGAVSLLL